MLNIRAIPLFGNICYSARMTPQQQEFFEEAAQLHIDGHEGRAEDMYKKLLEQTRHAKALSYLAEIYMNREEYGEAEELLDEALELDENDSSIWINLGNLHYLQEQKDPAILAFKRAADLDPEDEISRYQLAVLQGKSEEAAKYGQGYAESLFDDYAANFEDALVKDLNYATPENFRKILKDNLGKKWQMPSALDLGCGTGLVGEVIDDHVELLDGVDLSEGMLDVAEKKELYSQLHKGDIVNFLKEHKDQYDLMVAGDVLVYLGDLKDLFKYTYKRLNNEGYLLVSVEDGDFGLFENYKVQPSGRFCHKESYVKKLAEKQGLAEIDYQYLRLRDENGNPLMGHHFLFKKL